MSADTDAGAADDGLEKVDISVGDAFVTDDVNGEVVEVTNERKDGDEVCLHHPDRESPQGGAYSVWRPRETVEHIAAREGWELQYSTADADADEETMPGRWSDDELRCPECGAFMDRRFDGWFPIAVCVAPGCSAWYDERELIDDGYYIPQ